MPIDRIIIQEDTLESTYIVMDSEFKIVGNAPLTLEEGLREVQALNGDAAPSYFLHRLFSCDMDTGEPYAKIGNW